MVTRHIKAGDEILVSYGQEYWRSAHSSHFTVDIPEWEWDASDPFAAPSLGVSSRVQVEDPPRVVSSSPARVVLVEDQPALSPVAVVAGSVDPPSALC